MMFQFLWLSDAPTVLNDFKPYFRNCRQKFAKLHHNNYYPRRARSALGVDTVLTLDVCLYVSALERKRLIGMT